MGMTAYPDVRMHGTLEELKVFAKNHPNHQSYTYSIEHQGTVYHYGADYHNYLGNNPA